jgi:hypothetical protein
MENPYNMTGVTTTEDGVIVGTVPLLDDMEKVCKGSVHPNAVHYVDGQGNERHIHIPQDKYELVNELFVNQEWDELAKFEDWSKFIIPSDAFVVACTGTDRSKLERNISGTLRRTMRSAASG